MKNLPVTNLNTLLLVDSYEPSHFAQYPETAVEMTSYLAFRRDMPAMTSSEMQDLKIDTLPENDPRMVFFGIRYTVETYIAKLISHDDIDAALFVLKHHNAGNTKFPFPEAEFRRVVDEFGGQVPIKIEALPDGTVVRKNLPLVQITSDIAGLAPLVSWYEALIVQLWYPSEVATISRRMRETIDLVFSKSVSPDAYWKRESRIHNFGFRGAAAPEAGLIGGMAQLLSHNGTDILIAVEYAMRMNRDRPIGESIPAMAHCTITAFTKERDAMEQMIDKYGEGVYAIVLDSYDPMHVVDITIPSLKDFIVEKGGFLVYRPDSGDYIDMVLMCLKAAEATFGVDVNDKGYKVIRGAGVIQGSGMSPAKVERLYYAVISAGYSAENVAVGMGGALMQKGFDRDIVSAGFKNNYIKFKNGAEKLVMKCPIDAPGKWSLPGKLAVKNGIVYPKDMVSDDDNELKLIYDGANGGLQGEGSSFNAMRGRVMTQWNTVLEHWHGDVLSAEMHKLQDEIVGDIRKKI